jgi:PAS domain S-box-containing protein
MKNDNESGAAMNLDDEIEEFLGKRLLGAELQLSASETLELIHELKSQQLKIESLEAKLKLANEQPKYSGDKKSELLNDSSIGFLSINREGFIIEANLKAAQLLNQEQSSLKNSLLDNYISVDSKQNFKSFLTKIFTGEKEESCEITLIQEGGTTKFIYLTGLVADDPEMCKLSILDIAQHKRQTVKREEPLHLIMNFNAKGDFRGWISELIESLQGWSGCEAVAIHLRDGDDDYPYFETRGFPASFIRAENHLCTYGFNGNPELDCICGNILCGRTDPLNPFFTLHGSFWSNNTTNLLSNTEETDYQTQLFNRCNKAGYESVALIPLRSKDQVFGLLQFNDSLPDRFSLAIIEDLEKMADYLALSLSLRKAQKALQKREKDLSNILEYIGDAVIATNISGKIKFMNPVAEDLTGWELSDAKLKPVKDVFKIYKKLFTIEEGKSLTRDLKMGRIVNRTNHNILIRKDGKEIPIDGSRTIIKNKNGKKTGIVLVFRDVTEQKWIEEDLIRAKKKAEESDYSKSAFLANMSHEIRTPMNGILGFAELLKDPKITAEEQLEYIGIIEKSGERMLNIINDIISISKVESGQMQVSISETNANDQIEFIYNFFRHEAEQKGINLKCKTPLPAKDSVLKTDREKVYAVLTNLVKNAIKFTRQGYIELGYEKKGGYLEFYVKDTGNGIPKEEQDMIFERFKQANVPLTGNYESSGLGLSISKAYVEMLGGKIWVESEIGKGSVFYFTLPYNGEGEGIDNMVETKEIKTSADEEKTRLKKLKILIVDDDEVSTLFLQKVIGRYGREILKVRTGVQAVEICQNIRDIDLILMDIELPELDGYKATERIRLLNKDVVIIAQTAFALYNDSGKAIEAGCNDYIAKPINQVLLNEIINKHFSFADEEMAQGIG